MSFTYNVAADPAVDRRTKIRRYTYNRVTETLGSPVDVITGLPGSDDHNSARLLFGPDGKLYYTIGDQGNNQFARMCNPNRAQELPTAAEVAAHDWSKYVGKILRLNVDGSIPKDNPKIDGVRSHIYSYGHRNAQGLTFGRGDKLYANEHGPKSDDELNLIQAGKNYGWPYVAGYKDDQAYTYDNWSASSPTPCNELSWSDFAPPESVPRQLESAFSHPDFKEPLLTFYTVPNDYVFFDWACGFSQYICWPTIAPSSLHYYPAGHGIRGWGHSLLMTSLKKGAVYKVKLSPNGKSVEGEPVVLFQTTNRYRDLAMSPDRKTFYIITDTTGNTSGPTRRRHDGPGQPGGDPRVQVHDIALSQHRSRGACVVPAQARAPDEQALTGRCAQFQIACATRPWRWGKPHSAGEPRQAGPSTPLPRLRGSRTPAYPEPRSP